MAKPSGGSENGPRVAHVVQHEEEQIPGGGGRRAGESLDCKGMQHSFGSGSAAADLVQEAGLVEFVAEAAAKQLPAHGAHSSDGGALFTTAGGADRSVKSYGSSVTKSDSNEKEIRPKNPLFIKACEEATKALAKLDELRLLALKVKKEASISKIQGQGEQARRAAAASDYSALRQMSKDARCGKNGLEHGTTSSLLRCRIKDDRTSWKLGTLNLKPGSHGFVDYKALRKPGLDMIRYKQSFAIPSCAKSGNVFIDNMNIILFDLYMLIDAHLERGDVAAVFSMLGCEDESSDRKDCKAAVSMLRCTCKTARSYILDLGALPIKEPSEYWRERFPLVKF